MKVAELIKLFSFFTRYKIIGAKTGKTLYKSWSNKNLDKFKDLDVAETPIEASFLIQGGVIKGQPDYIRPIILIYVSGL